MWTDFRGILPIRACFSEFVPRSQLKVAGKRTIALHEASRKPITAGTARRIVDPKKTLFRKYLLLIIIL